MEILDENYLAFTLLVTIGMQMSFFAIAYTCQFDKVTDLAGSMNFVVLAWLTYGLRETYHTRQLVVTCLVTAWGVRLGSFLLVRVIQRGNDARFDEMRAKFWSFLGFWVYQIFWVWIVSLAVIFLNAAPVDEDLGARDYAGWAIWGIGFVFEAFADQQKMNFNNNKANKGKLLRTGVWSVSRHPNYFGEIACWLGIFLSCSAVFSNNTEWAYWSAISPVFTFFLLCFISGIPLAEERYDERFKADPEYWEYKRTTSPLVPMPSCLYAVIPNVMRVFCLCEFPLYNKRKAETPVENIL